MGFQQAICWLADKQSATGRKKPWTLGAKLARLTRSELNRLAARSERDEVRVWGFCYR